MPFQISIAFLGHTFTQQPQATQSLVSTKAFRFFFFTSTGIPPEDTFYIYKNITKPGIPL